MIESWYWRREIAADIRWLKQNRRFRRWSERRVVLFERKLMLIAFQVRSLLERPKVNDRTKSLSIKVVRYRKVGPDPFTVVGPGSVEDRFDLTSRELVDLSVTDVCNQFVHYYWMQTGYENGTFTSILIFSDRARKLCAYEFDVLQVIQLFSAFSDERSAIQSGTFVWDEKKQDYIVRASSSQIDKLPMP